MAIGTTVDFAVTRDDIIQEALEQLGVVPLGGTPEAATVTSLARTLNMMLKSWQADSVTMTTRKVAYLYPAANTASYTLLGGGTDRYSYTYVKTTVDGDVSSGAATIVVDSVTGIANTYRIGVYQSDGTMHWTTVNGAPAGTTVTLTAVTTADIDDGATVYCFPATNADRPMSVEAAWIRDEDGHDTPIDVEPFVEYMAQVDKSTEGRVSMVSYDAQIVTPKLYVWPVSEDPRHVIVLLIKRSCYDFDAANENPDFPQEAYMAIAMNLAAMAAPKLAEHKLATIAPIAGMLYEAYADYAGKPDGSVTFEVDLEG